MADATTELIVAALGAGSVGAVIAAVVTGLFSKRKLGAEAAEIITRAASGVVKDIEAQLARARQQLTEERDLHQRQMMAVQRDHELELTDIRAVLQLHVAWDTLALAELSKIGVDLPPVPPLLPPRLNKG